MSSPASIPSPVESLETTRRDSQQAAYKQLHATLQELDHLDVPVLDDSYLETLGIRKLPDIDVDEHAPFDPEPLFFRPYPLDDVDDLPGLVDDALEKPLFDIEDPWRTSCTESYCPGENIAHGFHCSCKRYKWVASKAGKLGDGLLGKTKWQYVK